MATLSQTQLADLRSRFQGKMPMPAVTKPQLATAFQQIEDWFETNRTGLAAAITGGYSAQEKDALLAQYLLQRAIREGA